MTPATHNVHDITTERVLFVAFERSETTWKLGFTTGHGQNPRERGVAARHQARLLQDVAQAKKRFGLHDERGRLSLQLRNKLCDIGCIMVNLPGLLAWTKHHVQLDFGNVNTDRGDTHDFSHT